MNRLSVERRAQIAHLLVEGSSMRSISRITGTDINTVMGLLRKLGTACEDYQDRTLVELTKCTRFELDEVWGYIHTKEDHLTPEKQGKLAYGDSYTWIAICPDTKLVPCFHVGKRTAADAQTFLNNLAQRVFGRIQISTDGFKAYPPAIEEAFGTDVDYAQLHKVFDNALDTITAADFLNKRRYVQPDLEATNKVVIFGEPDMDLVGTSYIERHNRTVRMSIRRMSRATDSFSKTYENHRAAMALMHAYYNFVRIHSTLRCTPAMEAGVADHVWSMEELVELQPLPAANRPTTYKKRDQAA